MTSRTIGCVCLAATEAVCLVLGGCLGRRLFHAVPHSLRHTSPRPLNEVALVDGQYPG